MFQSIETTRKRLKVFEQETAKLIHKGDEKFSLLMKQYMQGQEPVIHENEEQEEVHKIDETESDIPSNEASKIINNE